MHRRRHLLRASCASCSTFALHEEHNRSERGTQARDADGHRLRCDQLLGRTACDFLAISVASRGVRDREGRHSASWPPQSARRPSAHPLM